MALTPGTRLGAYEIISAIGAGGMGEVYRAKDARLGRDVAIKVLPESLANAGDWRARFQREAKAVAALSHPNIVNIYDTGLHEGHPFVVMELLDGETLRDRLTGGALPVRKAVEIAVQIARGLGAAHDKQIMHRDLKPENLFVIRDGQVKILDFGLAREIATNISGAAETRAGITDAGIAMGTVGYMAPEQVRGQVADGRSDLFAFGAVLYEMLSGQRAFARDTAADTMMAILQEDPPEFSRTRVEIPPALDRIVRHCLEKNVAERFQSARDVAFALEALSGSAMGSGATAIAPPTRERRGRRWAIVAVLVVCAAITGGVIGRRLAPQRTAPTHFTEMTFESQSIANARFMPDGRAIVFSSALTGNAVRLFEIRSGMLEARAFGPPRTHLLSVSSKGELAVLTDVSFIAQRLFRGTLARTSIEGSPRPWMEGVREADWSPDGSTLAIVHDLGTKDRLEYPIGTVLYETAGYVSDPRVSPDGTRVAFMDHQARFDDRGWVKVVDATGKVTTLAGEFSAEEGLAWSRDGATVFFAATDRQAADETRANMLAYQVRAVAIDNPGSSASALTSPGDFMIHDIALDGRWLATREDARVGIGAHLAGDTIDRDLTWLKSSWGPTLSRNGARVLFSDGAAGENYGVVWRKTDRSPIVRLGDGDSLAWSPDETWALARIYTPPQLVLYPMGAGEPVRLERGGIAHYQWAFWFPDGKSLLVVANEPGKPTRAYRQAVPSGEPTPLLEEGVYPAALAPDGQTILGVDRELQWRWYPLTGGAPRTALGLTAQDSPAGWSSDGKALFVRSGTDIPAQIDRIDIATGHRTLLGEIGPTDRSGLFTVDSVTVSRDGAQYAYRYWKRLSTLFVVSPAL